MIFAIPVTWDFLGEIDQKILAYFVRAYIILTSWELQKNELDEAFIKLFEMNKLIERKYGQEKISSENRYQSLFKLNSSIMILHIEQDKRDI